MTAISSLITAFFQDYLPHQRGASPHTRDAYADSFRLFFEFARHKLKIAPSAMQLEQIDAPLILDFLDYLEHHRANSVRTRNLRLAAFNGVLSFRRAPPASGPGADSSSLSHPGQENRFETRPLFS